MPMLRGCAFPGCETLTLSTYCLEHELLLQAAACEEALVREMPTLDVAAAQTELPAA